MMQESEKCQILQPKEWHTTPLHIVLSLAGKCFFGELKFSLPDFIQIVLDAGVPVTAHNVECDTPLQASALGRGK